MNIDPFSMPLRRAAQRNQRSSNEVMNSSPVGHTQTKDRHGRTIIKKSANAAETKHLAPSIRNSESPGELCNNHPLQKIPQCIFARHCRLQGLTVFEPRFVNLIGAKNRKRQNNVDAFLTIFAPVSMSLAKIFRTGSGNALTFRSRPDRQ